MHQKVCKVATSMERNTKERVSSEMVEHMQKFEKEVHTEKEKLLNIVEDFHTIIHVSHFME